MSGMTFSGLLICLFSCNDFLCMLGYFSHLFRFSGLVVNLSRSKTMLIANVRHTQSYTLSLQEQPEESVDTFYIHTVSYISCVENIG